MGGGCSICCGGCRDGYANDGCLCRKRDIGLKRWRQQRSYCRDDENSDGHFMCYPKCAAGYHKVGTLLCEPDDGPGGMVKVSYERRKYCNDGDERSGEFCYPKCPSGYYVSTPNICSPNEGVGIKVSLGQRQYCNDDEEMLDSLCYKKCPSGWTAVGTGAPTMCKPDPGPIGRKVAWLDRQYCMEWEEMKGGLCYAKKKSI